MRADMKHVIIDRPRTGGDGGKSIPPKGKKRRMQRMSMDELPRFESSGAVRAYGWGCKNLNEHLSPLLRWLHSQIGRDWDEVWSEICQGLSVRNATTAHVRDHADQFVEKNCVLKNGKVYDSQGNELMGGRSWHRFYVHPLTNKLCAAAPYRKWKPTKPKQDWIAGKDGNHRYYKLKGLWYEVELAAYPGMSISWDSYYHYHQVAYVRDAVLVMEWEGEKPYSRSTQSDCDRRHGKKGFYAKSKRQLSKKDIKKLQLD